MAAIEYTPPAEEPGGDYPFRLTTGRVVYQYLSGNQTRRLGFLNSQAPEPWVEIHPRAAEPLGIRNDDRVRVRTPRGAMELKAMVGPTIRPDTLLIPFRYGHEQAVNWLTNPAVERTVKSPEYKVSAATIECLDQPERALGEGPRINYTPANGPKMFPYAVGETKNPSAVDGKTF
jgi:assimilatory nitrate reductase catalytic subunit